MFSECWFYLRTMKIKSYNYSLTSPESCWPTHKSHANTHHTINKGKTINAYGLIKFSRIKRGNKSVGEKLEMNNVPTNKAHLNLFFGPKTNHNPTPGNAMINVGDSVPVLASIK